MREFSLRQKYKDPNANRTFPPFPAKHFHSVLYATMLPSIMARRSVFHSLGRLAGLPVSCRMASSSFVSPACGSSIQNTGSKHRYPSLLQTRGKHRAFEAPFLQVCFRFWVLPLS
jgi:hypothetical protein